MIRTPGAYRIPPPAPAQDGGQTASARATQQRAQQRAQLCTHCGAVGTHYLTCTSLRLPEGYRLGQDTRPGCACGLAGGTCRMCA